MNHRKLGMLVAGLALAVALTGCAQALTGLPGLERSYDQAVRASGTAGRYVVVFKSTSVPENADRLVAAAGGTPVESFPEVGVVIATSDDPGFADALRGASNVYAVGAERYLELPPLEVREQVESGPTATDDYYELFQWDIRRVRADQAWPTTSGSHDTVVAILDTGIAWNHPDLAPNVVFHTCYSVFTPCTDYPSLHWHGTHVAGTVAAAFDGGRAVGVGPNLGLASYNVFEPYPPDPTLVVAFDSALWAAMLDAAARGFDVINMSLGGYVVFPASVKDVAAWTAWKRVAEYVTRRGVTIVASAGNADFNLNGPVAHIPSDVPDVISVGATGIRPDPAFPQEGFYDVRAFYSNTGASVTLAAPGGDLGPEGTPLPFPGAFYLVFSTFVVPDPACAATASCPVGYAWAGGTSMAAPHVSGTGGLLRDHNPGLSPRQVTAILKRTAEWLGDRQQFGQGMVDAAAAVGQ